MSNQNNHEVSGGHDQQTRPESIPNVPNSGSSGSSGKKNKKSR